MSTTGTTISLEQRMLGEVEMVGRDRCVIRRILNAQSGGR